MKIERELAGNKQEIMNEVIEEIANIKDNWKSYAIENIEIYGVLTVYWINLHEGEIENQGEVVENVRVEIQQNKKEGYTAIIEFE